jgi:hypothetical protein
MARIVPPDVDELARLRRECALLLELALLQREEIRESSARYARLFDQLLELRRAFGQTADLVRRKNALEAAIAAERVPTEPLQ